SPTSEPTTVEGTVALYQPLARYRADEILAPSVPAFADDWMAQPSCSVCRSCGRAAGAAQTSSSAATWYGTSFTRQPPGLQTASGSCSATRAGTPGIQAPA